ncbi:MAG TPA: pentapeptide repeat-containing protein [Rhizomicrobium sp.]|nr:pentapeptide repeat-containing protein [Rhizomicrobium sp.]
MRLFFACLLTLLTSAAFAASAPPDASAIAGIRAGRHDCPHCYLAHADLTNQCVKHGNLEGAVFDDARLTLMCMSYGDFRNASFRGADLSGANLAHAELDGADLSGARLTITSIRAADMSHAKGLTQSQLDQACGDADTRLPANLHVKTCS